MKRTKLEEYIAIIQIVLTHGPINLAEIESLLPIIDLRDDLTFLLEQKAVQERFSEATLTYVAAPLGIRLVKYFVLKTSMAKLPR